MRYVKIWNKKNISRFACVINSMIHFLLDPEKSICIGEITRHFDIRRFISVLKRAQYLSLSDDIQVLIQSMLSYPISAKYSLILFSHWRPDLPCNLFLSDFLTKILYALVVSPIRVRCTAYLILFHLIILIIDSRVHVTKLLIMQFFPATYYFLYLRSEYSLRHPILSPQIYVFLSG